MSVTHSEYAGYTLKHLLLRHMYNLPLLNYVLLYWWIRSCRSLLIESALLSAEATDRMSERCTVLYGGLNSELV